jgi:predicted O-methyltransferase YrrM
MRPTRVSSVLEQAYREGSVPDSDGAPVPLAPHSVDWQQGEALRDLALSEEAKRTIEVGLALGISALFFAQAALERGGRHLAIDPFQQESWNGAGLRTLRAASVGELVSSTVTIGSKASSSTSIS